MLDNITPIPLELIRERIRDCPRLPSLSTINNQLQQLVKADQYDLHEIAQIIRKDPGLTSRILRIVNSAYYGLNVEVQNIEEAVFYLGIEPIRELATVTPVIEDFQRLIGGAPFPWPAFWQHCFGVGILSRELLSFVKIQHDEIAYIAGLLHDIGKIIMAYLYPVHFQKIYQLVKATGMPLKEAELSIIGIDHSTLGSMYLELHGLNEPLISTIRYHHEPDQGGPFSALSAIVGLSDMMIRNAGIGYSGNLESITNELIIESSFWNVIFPNHTQSIVSRIVPEIDKIITNLPELVKEVL